MAKPHQRVAALIIALLFFVTSVATGILVIYQIREDDKNRELAEITNQTENLSNPEGGDVLKGTILANYSPEDVSELKKVDLVEGTGEVVAEGATVTAHYTGALASDGTIFESSKDSGQPATFPLSNVIAGWQEGVPGMKVGGTRRLIIPANLAYGEAGSPPAIGPNEPLVFDIELIAVEQ